ncbi:hypothetical protein [Xenorhabdus doucetiae]|uniref:Uncharacterized protein n=1 Tax=Xenorhabdus doucetiae TaxID=351671 RepID=A0A068QW40_9GAMM|nr:MULTISPECIES: hypothetical protein [Xenorhabdus]MBD2795259.1 hypothetical protein [Xenorhabdus sp. 18]TYP05643.1 hypothetical protein LY16_02011 [Xenorhabdus doucetiae]CDG18095.1 protein of unknown function [Xenorhabdus doucetiae]
MTNSTPIEPNKTLDKKIWTDIESLVGDIATTIDDLLNTLRDADVISADIVKIITTVINRLAEAIEKIIEDLFIKDKK